MLDIIKTMYSQHVDDIFEDKRPSMDSPCIKYIFIKGDKRHSVLVDLEAFHREIKNTGMQVAVLLLNDMFNDAVEAVQ